MTEEKKPKIDRFNVDKKDFSDFNRLKENDTPFAGAHNKEVFLAAMVVGYHEGCRIEIKNKLGYFLEKDLSKEDAALIRAIAVAEEGGLNVLLDKQKIYSVAEQYATGGISLLKAKVLSGEYGSYAKKLESELLKTYEKIPKDEPEKIEEQAQQEVSAKDLINRGESETVEFKSTMQWDTRKNQSSRELKIAIAKEVAAFMNTKGGTLLIGVDDNKTISGLDRDLAVLHDSTNEFELTFTNIVGAHLQKLNRVYVDLEFKKVGDKNIAVVRVKKSPHPVYVRCEGKKEEFCIRAGNSSQTLEVSEASLYIKEHWPDLR